MRGFSLVELLVALTVLAVVSMTVFARGGDTLNQLYSLEDRTLARWVAENHVAVMRLERDGEPVRTGRTTTRVDLGERSWRVAATVEATPNPELWQVTVEVHTVREDDAGPVDTLTAFLGRY